MEVLTKFTQVEPSWTLWICFAIAIFIVYSVVLITYRLFFSPIAKFPGPKIAAATSWYEFYYDVLRPGMYIFEIEKMHQKYGMYSHIVLNRNEECN